MAASIALPSRSATLKGSHSLPSFRAGGPGGQQPAAAAVHHRGSNVVGTVIGLAGDDIYVPRAMWTESVDSTLREREFDPRKFVEEELHKQSRQQGLRKHLTREMGRQLEAKAPFRHTIAEEKRGLAQNTGEEVERMVREQALENEERERNRRALRTGLDEQVARNARRAEESRLREARDAAEMKMRTVQQLCEEVAEQSRQKKACKLEALEAKREREARARKLRDERQSEAEDVRRATQMQAVQEEQRLVAQHERLRAAQAGLDARSGISRPFLEAEAQRRASEELRQARDEERHQVLTDAHYARREAARDRQRQKMVQGLQRQVDVKQQQGIIPLIQKQAELDAVNESTRRNLEHELQKMYHRRAEQMELQSTLLAQMREKQVRAAGDGYRPPPAAATMIGGFAGASPTAGNSGGRQGGSSCAADSTGLAQRVDAPRYVIKPLGRGAAVDIERGHGLGGVVGVFGGGSAQNSALAATGGPMRLLTKASDLAARDRQLLQSSWAQGLTKQEMRAGLRNAAKRGSATAADKSNTT